MTGRKTFAIVGAGGMGREVMSFFSESLRRLGFDVSFADDGRAGQTVHGVLCRGLEEVIRQCGEDLEYAVALGSSSGRQAMRGRLPGRPRTLVHETAFVGSGVVMGDGALICPQNTLTTDIVIGEMFQGNVNCHIAHDCVIGDYVTFGPGVHCNGNVHIGDHAYVGSGAVIKHGSAGSPLVIGEGAVVGMGAVVTRSVPPFTTVVGSPARPLVRKKDLPGDGMTLG